MGSGHEDPEGSYFVYIDGVRRRVVLCVFSREEDRHLMAAWDVHGLGNVMLSQVFFRSGEDRPWSRSSHDLWFSYSGNTWELGILR